MKKEKSIPVELGEKIGKNPRPTLDNPFKKKEPEKKTK